MKVNLDQNLQYYHSEQSVPCDCEVCQNYYKQIKEIYPEIAEFLSSIGVDILRPFELIWNEDKEKNEIEYIGCQYIVFGSCKNNYKKKIGDIVFETNTLHPSTEHILGEHFVLDFGIIILKDISNN